MTLEKTMDELQLINPCKNCRIDKGYCEKCASNGKMYRVVGDYSFAGSTAFVTAIEEGTLEEVTLRMLLLVDDPSYTGKKYKKKDIVKLVKER